MDRVEVSRGDAVSKGQAVAYLESRVERATVALARARAARDQLIKAKRARAEFAKRRLERNQALAKTNSVSDQAVDEAETEAILAEMELGEALEEKRIAELELRRAQAALETRTIRSPIDGRVVDVFIEPGESVEDRPILQIARIDPLHVEVIAPVSMLGQIEPGVAAEVRLEEPVGGSYKAVVTVVDRLVDAASGTFGVRLELPNPEGRLPAGLRCRVRFPDRQ
jgi:RND family efflux transporter MFP subunit